MGALDHPSFAIDWILKPPSKAHPSPWYLVCPTSTLEFWHFATLSDLFVKTASCWGHGSLEKKRIELEAGRDKAELVEILLNWKPIIISSKPDQLKTDMARANQENKVKHLEDQLEEQRSTAGAHNQELYSSTELLKWNEIWKPSTKRANQLCRLLKPFTLPCIGGDNTFSRRNGHLGAKKPGFDG
ncbi:hypothetical protein DAPPUDRAFT_110846 [Daphnia pulex]|uniref:Uncharacterized protein n=1 Tax=Daphnia pulex TaxID=6669 RepID=E9H7B8_DAPPU|nr:hypothetical protein DAPPUDRAFT_110846 [Daphnia pulex]|eukprot:EFX72393.1 hypothetical protein DAPPUDRAFT_110846 [Daphnia pulex]